MIVLNIQFLHLIGMPVDEAAAVAVAPTTAGLAVSHIFSFGGSGDPRSLDEARASSEKILLVGMADRYDYAKTLGAEIRQICVDGFHPRLPSAEEAAELQGLFAASAHPAASRIGDLIRAL